MVFAKNKDKRRNKAENKSKSKKDIATERQENGQDKAKSGTEIKKHVSVTTEKPEKKTEEEPDEPCEHIMVFPDAGELLHFRTKNYKVLFSIGSNLSCMNQSFLSLTLPKARAS